MTSKRISNARECRKRSTPSEGLLWSILRARQLCGLKFRREHPIGGFIADFACEAKMLVVENAVQECMGQTKLNDQPLFYSFRIIALTT
jgi:very-short-patch-repair endonuclease